MHQGTHPGPGVFACPFHKLALYEIGELPATRMLWSRPVLCQNLIHWQRYKSASERRL